MKDRTTRTASNDEQCVLYQNYNRVLKETKAMKLMREQQEAAIAQQQPSSPMMRAKSILEATKCPDDIECGGPVVLSSTNSGGGDGGICSHNNKNINSSGIGELLLDFIQCTSRGDIEATKAPRGDIKSTKSSLSNPYITTNQAKQQQEEKQSSTVFKSCFGNDQELRDEIDCTTRNSFADESVSIQYCDSTILPPLVPIKASTSETVDGDDDDDTYYYNNESKGKHKKSSTTNKQHDILSHTDPFALREGRTLSWQNVNMTLVRRIV
jgi:hypothetical protein